VPVLVKKEVKRGHVGEKGERKREFKGGKELEGGEKK
jgi:hypothetical protein